MDHHGLRHHDEERHFDELDGECPSCGKFFLMGKGRPTACMQCGIELRPMRSKTSPANQEDMHIREMPNQGTMKDTGGNPEGTGIFQFRNGSTDQVCKECGVAEPIPQDIGGAICGHCHAPMPDPITKTEPAEDPEGLGELDPYKEAVPKSMSTWEQKGWGGGGSRKFKDEGFTASVHQSDIHMEVVEVIQPDSEIIESQSEYSIRFSNGITDALHEALKELNIWVENPEENGKLRPYRDYSSVIRPKINVGQVRIGVEDPHMAEIINHVAQTDDTSVINKESFVRESIAPLAAPAAPVAAEGAVVAGTALARLAPWIARSAPGAARSAGNLMSKAFGKVKGAIPGVGGSADGAASVAGKAGTLGKLKNLAKQGIYWNVGTGIAENALNSIFGTSPESQQATAPSGYSTLFPGGGVTSHLHESVYGQGVDTPSSITQRVDTEDPENVDPHEINDGDNNAINGYDPRNNGMGQGRSPRGEDKNSHASSPAIEKFLDMIDVVLDYADSDESAANDSKMIELHEMLEDEFPGYLDSDEMPDEENPIIQLLIELAGDQFHDESNHHHGTNYNPASALGVDPNLLSSDAEDPFDKQPAEVRPSQGKDLKGHVCINNDPSSCPHCRGSAAAAGSLSAGKGTSVTNRTWPEVFDPARDGSVLPAPQQVASKVAANHQGPHTQEQFIAVAELLEQEDREDEIVDLLKNPEEFAEELATIQGTQSPAEDIDFDSMSAAPPQPAQEGPAPNQGMPMPPMGGPGAGGAPGGGLQMGASMLKAAFKYSADNVAGTCPKCKSHSTKMINQKGKCRCHTCYHTWVDKHFEPSDGDSSNSSTTSSTQYHSFNDLVSDDIEVSPSSETSVWKDVNGDALSKGKEYTMNSSQYSIPDKIRILEISPEYIKIVLNEDSGLAEHEEITAEDLMEKQITFSPGVGGSGNDSENLDDGTFGIEDKIAPTPGQTSDLSSPHRFTGSVQRLAGKHYTPMEQRELIDERGEARNADKLDLRNTHYVDNDDDYFLFGC